VTLTYHALWMLCALGAAVFATAAAANLRTIAVLVVGFVPGVFWWSGGRLPDAAMAGTLTLVAAAVYLFRPRLRVVAAAVGGILGGMLSAMLQVQGVPASLSPLVSATLIVVAVWLARARPSFAPEQLRDDAMLIVGVLGVSVAILPGVLDGWQAATNLSAATERVPTSALPSWTLLLLIMTSSAGAAYSLWSRR
jgi:hypothetical protein